MIEDIWKDPRKYEELKNKVFDKLIEEGLMSEGYDGYVTVSPEQLERIRAKLRKDKSNG